MTIGRAGRGAALLFALWTAACVAAAPRAERLRLPAAGASSADELRAVAAAPIRPPAADEIVLLHTNDVHGNLRPRTVVVDGETLSWGGAAALATFVRRWEAAAGGAENVLLLDAGDIFQGTPEGAVDGGRLVIDAMNRLGYDAAVAGNHEFDRGTANLAALAEAARFPLLSSNLRDPRTGAVPSYLRPSVLLDVHGVKIGVVGATTEDLPHVTAWSDPPPLLVLDIGPALRAAVRDLEARGARVIVALTHVGYDEEGVTDDSDIAQVGGIDVVVGGHSHTLYREAMRDTETGVWVVQAGSYGRYVGEAILRYDRAADRVVDLRWRAVPLLLDVFPPDESESAALAPAFAEIDREMERVVGTATAPLGRSTSGDAPPASPLGIWMAEVYRRRAGAAIGLMNVGGVRREIAAGPVRRRDLFEVAPFGNTIVRVEMIGREIEAVLERSLSQARGRLEVAGAVVYYDSAAPPGRRLVDVVLPDGSPLEPDSSYAVATNSFIADGGDGYEEFRAARNRRDLGLDLDALVAAFAAGPVSPPADRPYRALPAAP